MSVGYQRQYETEAVLHFARMVQLLAALVPDNPKLTAYSKEVTLRAIQVSIAEDREIKGGNAALDRAADCADCRREHGGAPCAADGHWGLRPCVYQDREHSRAAIETYFGERGLQMLDYITKWIAKRTEGRNDA